MYASLHKKFWLCKPVCLSEQIWMQIAGTGAAYTYISLPETMGMSLAAVQALLQEKEPSGKGPSGNHAEARLSPSLYECHQTCRFVHFCWSLHCKNIMVRLHETSHHIAVRRITEIQCCKSKHTPWMVGADKGSHTRQIVIWAEQTFPFHLN